MATNQSYSLSSDVWNIMAELVLGAAGAIVPDANGNTTSEPQITAAKTGNGTYVFTIPGNFQKVLCVEPIYRAAAASSVIAEITAVGLGTGAVSAGGEASTTVTVITGNSNAVPGAADQATGIVGFDAKFQKHKI